METPSGPLALLLTLGPDLFGVEKLGDLLTVALRRLMAYTQHDSGSIMLYDRERGVLKVRAALGDDAVQVGTVVPNIERSVSGQVLLSGKPLLLQGRGEAVGLEWRDYSRDIPSVVCLPLLLPERRPIGVLSLKSTARVRALDAEDLETLQLLAAQLAAVIENAQLHAERNRLLADLAERERRLQELLGDLLNAQEEERRRVAYQLHDGLAQVAASAYQHLQALAARYKPRSQAAREDLRQAIELSRRTVREARYLMASLRPTALDDLGLAVALRHEVEMLAAQGWEIAFEEPAPIGRLPSLIETTLFRIAQELLTNVRKHAGSTRARVRVERAGPTVSLSVQDWGVGLLEPSEPPQHARGERVGLRSITERVGILGGSLTVHTEPGKGATFTVSIPIGA
jgi:signal transduction histidine kinase